MTDPLHNKNRFAALLGYQHTRWSENSAEIELVVEAKHLNRSGVLHGGVLTTIIDAACGLAGTYSEDADNPRRAFTLSLTCQFIASRGPGARLIAKAERTGGGASVFFARCRVVDEQGETIATGEGVFKHLRRPPASVGKTE